MLLVWAICILGFFGLPFVLVGRTLSGWGFFVLALFLTAFVAGAVLRTMTWRGRPATGGESITLLDIGLFDRVMPLVALAAVALAGLELLRGEALDVSAAWAIRAERASDLILGRESSSSAVFQLAFILYPVSYAILVREILFRRPIVPWRLALYSGLPLLLMSMVMGGRSPLLYGLSLAFVAWRVRARLWKRDENVRREIRPLTILYTIVAVVIALAALNYFVVVFLVRAESVGGVEEMFDLVASMWGVTFEGPLADRIIATIGYGNTYLVFVFAWYLVQGLVMSNVIFTDFDTPAHLGMYGLEPVTAVMRRVNGDLVAERMAPLIDLNLAGYFPSAWGTLFIDYKYAGLLVAFLWGYLAALVYHRCKDRLHMRWFYLAPVVSLGIFFSLIATPLGFGNGMMTHFWVLIGFFMIKGVGVSPARSAPKPGPPNRNGVPRRGRRGSPRPVAG